MKTKFLLFATALLLISCNDKNDDSTPPVLITGAYADGLFVLEQGNFGAGNAEISFLKYGATTATPNVYGNTNGTDLGDTAQSISFYENFAFIIVNGSNKIEVVNRYTFSKVATIEGMNNPRYMAIDSNRGFVSNWGDGSDPNDDFVSVINLSNFTVTATIPVSEGPERVVGFNTKIYVLHAGGFGYGNKISVINSSTASLLGTIAVADVPVGAQVINNNMYVLCAGKPEYSGTETLGKLQKINLADNTVSDFSTFDFGSHPNNLISQSGLLYFSDGTKVYSKTVGNNPLPADLLFDSASKGVSSIYGMEIKGNSIYVCDPKDYNSNGKLYEFLNSGIKLSEVNVGIIPSGIYFN